MRPYLLFLFVFSGSIASTAQNSGVGFGIGFRSGNPKNKSYNQFCESYNQVYANDLAKPFNGMGLGAGYGIHGDITIEGFVMSARYAHFRNSDMAELKSGNNREIKMEQHYLAVGMGFGMQKKKGYFNVTLNMVTGNEILKSATIYPDGTRSYGMEKDLNGIFKGTRFAGSGNLEMGYSIFYVSAEYIFGKKANYSSDGNGQRMDAQLPDGLPTDVARWFNSPSAYDYGFENSYFVTPVTNGLFFEIGLRLNISDNDD